MNNPLNIFILCGGSGKRMNDYSFPKPLNMINGKPMIYYTLLNLPLEIKELNFIVAPHLIKYNFNEIIINLFPKIKCNFYNLPYFTRGAIESAYLGIKNCNINGSIVFLDNDNFYSFPNNFFKSYETPFIGYCINDSEINSFSFIQITNDYVSNIKEKIKISNNACCGVYGFKDLNQFKEIAYKILSNNNFNNLNEFYMSILYDYMIKENIKIEGIKFNNSPHIGSYHEITKELLITNLPKMRICFDLDNTIVTYPTISGDYSTVKPINNIINLIRKLKEDNHTIIIYTARRMKTHNNNIGACLADIGEITFKTLKDFNIPYDEIIFGKPIADIYIDDRSINPYKYNMNLLGLFDGNNDNNLPLNKLENNKYNSIELDNDNIIVKKGLSKFLEGEINFYKSISCIDDLNILNLFPIYYNSIINQNDGISKIYMENIKGIPFYTLYKNEMITNNHLIKLFDIIKLLHNYKNETNFKITINNNDIINNYTEKLKERFSILEDYPFDDASYIQNKCLEQLDDYYKRNNYQFDICNIIHGDLWFSNIIIDYLDNIKIFDMKGKVFDIYTTNGHNLYDYGKLYQSFLGFDEIIYNDKIDINYKNKMLHYYENYISSIGINLNDLKIITFSLVIGTLHFTNNINIKNNLWNWIKKTFI